MSKKINHFCTQHLQDNLKEYTFSGGISTFGAQGFGFLLNLASIMIMARLLTPYDFGLIAMVTAVTGLLAIFKEAGLSTPTVQQVTVTHEQVSTLFWINVGISLLLMVVVAGLSPWIAAFYHETKLEAITLAIAGMFIFDGLAAQHQAILRRQMNFGQLAKIQIYSNLLGVLSGIFSALMGANYWALIIQMGVSQIAALSFTWAYVNWLPGHPMRGVGTGAMVKLGAYHTGFNFVNYFGRNADNLLIGNVWGASALGIYSKAYGLLMLPLQQINGPIVAVALPALSRLQSKPEEFRIFFMDILRLASFLTFPIIAIIIICREELVLIVLGPQWQGVVPIFTILAISAFFQPIGNISGLLYLSLGRMRKMFIWGLIASAWIVSAFIIGLPYGAKGVAWAYIIAVALMMFPLILFAVSGTFMRIIDYYNGIREPIIALLISSLCGLLTYEIISVFKSKWLNLLSVAMVILCSHIYVSERIYPGFIGKTKNIFKRGEKN